MGEERNDFVDHMTDYFMHRIDEWLGFDIPEEGTEEHDMWMYKVAEVEQIQSLQGVITYIQESMGRDFAEFTIEGEYDLVQAGMNPLEIPRSVIVALGESIALEEEADAQAEYALYEYGGKYFAVPGETNANVRYFDSERDALAFLGMDAPADTGQSIDTGEARPVKPLSVDLDALHEDIKRYKAAVSRAVKRRPTRIIHVVIPEWPGGTMAIKFGSVLFSSLYTKREKITLVQFEPERIFRVESAVTETEFRETLSKYRGLGVSCSGEIRFIVGEMNLPEERSTS